MSTIMQGVTVNSEESVDIKRRSAIKGAVYSMYIDMFDIYLPVVVMAPVMFYFQPQGLSLEATTILTSLVFITTLLGRPLGSVLFGNIADRLGRRLASIYSVSGFAVITLLIGVLPGYETIGISAYLLLVFLRFVNGIFLGGGYTGAIPLALEYAKKEHRGFVGGLILAAFPAAYVSINLLTMLMLFIFPLAEPDSAYVMWGWRIPFFIGGGLSALLAIYYIRKVSESEVWESKKATEKEAVEVKKKQKQPLTELLKGDSGRNLLQVLVMMTGFWLTQNLITIFLPSGLLVRTLNLSALQMATVLMITYATLIVSYILSGMLAQKIGRKTHFLLAGSLIATVGAYILYILSTVQLSFPMIILLVCIMCVIVTSPWGVIVTYINERFATGVRATGFGVGYSLSVVIPSFYAFYISWLGYFVPYHIAPVILLILGGVIGVIGASLGPETKDVDFQKK